jgi:hypothetical protein
VLNIGVKHLGVSRPVDDHDRLEVLYLEGAQHGDILVVVLGHAAHAPLAWESAAIQERQGQIDTRCTDTLQALVVKRRDSQEVDRACFRDEWWVPLAGAERLFLRGSSSCMTTHDMVGTLMWRPCWAHSRPHNSSHMASACS